MQDPDRPMTTITVVGKEISIPVDLANKLADPDAVLTAEELAQCGIFPGMGPEIRVERRPPGDYPDRYRR
jgi:hypothetical protein